MKTTLPFAALVALVGCSDGRTHVEYTMPDMRPAETPGVEEPTEENTPPPEMPAGCDQGYTYVGFGGTRLEVGRDDDEAGFDRDRVKPLSALRGEYARVLGTTPALLDQLSNTFGSVPPRWYVEPEATAVSLFSAMRVSFVGCLAKTNTAEFDVTPDLANARTHCTRFARTFWSRTPDADEVDACAEVVTQKTASETNNRRKWAYACASVLSSASFLTY